MAGRIAIASVVLWGFVSAGTALGQDELVLGDFEGKLDARWAKNGSESTVSFVAEHATRGKRALKLLVKGKYPGIRLDRPAVADWSKYDKMKMDIFNPSDEVLKLHIGLRDRASGGSWHNRATLPFSVRPGKNPFEFNVTGIKANNGRVMDRSQIAQMLIMLDPGKEPIEVYIDNIRLVKEKVVKAQGLRAFDFGKPESPVFPGFTAVTARTRYNDRSGFGWLNTGGLTSADHVTPGALERDWVRGGGTFGVKAENGRYRVWMLMADSGDWGFFQHWSRKVVKAEGRTVLDERKDRADFMKTYFGSLDLEDLPGQDPYPRYIETRWRPIAFDVEVTDGRLDVALSGDESATIVNAMVVYPLSQKQSGEAWLKDLEERRRKAYHTTHVEFPSPEKLVTVVPNAAQKKCGYLVFQRPWSEPVWPTSSPKGGGREVNSLDISLARGEFEPITFSIYPLGDLGKVKVRADLGIPVDRAADLTGVGYVQYKIKRHGFKVTRYQVRPLLIRRKSEAPVTKGVTRRFWLTAHIPAGVRGGKYKGSIVITPEHGEPTTLPLSVTVHDFVLAEPGDRMFALCGTKSQPFYTWVGGSSEEMWKAFGRSWKNQREHGFNTIICGSDPGEVRRIMTAAKPYGMAPLFKCWLMHGNRYHDGVAADAERKMRPIIAEAKRNGWPEPVFTFLDEPANGGEVTRIPALKLAKALRTIKGVKLSGDLNGPKDTDFAPFLDYTGFNDGTDICPATFRKIRDAGSVPWLVNAGKDRFWWGFWFYKVSRDHGVMFKEDYAYMTWHGDPFYDLDAWNSDYCAAYPGPDGDINTTWFEGCREGIDDFRYLWMLDRMVKLSKNDARSKEASEFLSRIRTRVNADRSENKPWSYDECQKMRLEAAGHISKLIAAGVKAPK